MDGVLGGVISGLITPPNTPSILITYLVFLYGWSVRRRNLRFDYIIFGWFILVMEGRQNCSGTQEYAKELEGEIPD